MMIIYTVRIRDEHGIVHLINQTHSQLVHTLKGAPVRRNLAFWRGEVSVVNALKQDVFLIVQKD